MLSFDVFCLICDSANFAFVRFVVAALRFERGGETGGRKEEKWSEGRREGAGGRSEKEGGREEERRILDRPSIASRPARTFQNDAQNRAKNNIQNIGSF